MASELFDKLGSFLASLASVKAEEEDEEDEPEAEAEAEEEEEEEDEEVCSRPVPLVTKLTFSRLPGPGRPSYSNQGGLC